jgi:hypothetical protein
MRFNSTSHFSLAQAIESRRNSGMSLRPSRLLFRREALAKAGDVDPLTWTHCCRTTPPRWSTGHPCSQVRAWLASHGPTMHSRGQPRGLAPNIRLDQNRIPSRPDDTASGHLTTSPPPAGISTLPTSVTNHSSSLIPQLSCNLPPPCLCRSPSAKS